MLDNRVKCGDKCITGIVVALVLVLIWLTYLRDRSSVSSRLYTSAPKRSNLIFAKPQSEYPFMAFLYIERANADSQICGGTLIHDRYILTAAHCVKGATRISIILGISNVVKDGNFAIHLQSNISIIHENYDSKTYTHDIALIYLDQPVPKNESVRAELVFLSPNRDIRYKANSCTVLGWGFSCDPTGGGNDFLLPKKVNITNTRQCFPSSKGYNGSKICAVGKFGPYHGDSGGPLICESVQIGVVSGGAARCEGSAPSLYEDIADHWDWIQDKIGNNLTIWYLYNSIYNYIIYITISVVIILICIYYSVKKLKAYCLTERKGEK